MERKIGNVKEKIICLLIQFLQKLQNLITGVVNVVIRYLFDYIIIVLCFSTNKSKKLKIFNRIN
jgi:hypothetical protein